LDLLHISDLLNLDTSVNIPDERVSWCNRLDGVDNRSRLRLWLRLTSNDRLRDNRTLHLGFLSTSHNAILLKSALVESRIRRPTELSTLVTGNQFVRCFVSNRPCFGGGFGSWGTLSNLGSVTFAVVLVVNPTRESASNSISERRVDDFLFDQWRSVDNFLLDQCRRILSNGLRESTTDLLDI